MLIRAADMRQPKPGLELSFHSGMGLVTIEAHSERARKWLAHRFGKVAASVEPRLTKEIPNLGFVLCVEQSVNTDEIEAEVSKLGFVTQWNPASQKEIDFARASRRSTEAERNAAPHPNENTPLHANLATYFCEFVGSTPYRKLEERFLLRMKEKEDTGVPLDAEEKGLLNRIKFCCKCGTKNPVDSAYCFNCGQQLLPKASG